MKKLTREQLATITGGVNISGTFINAIIKGVNSFLDLGRSIGTAIRRIQTGNICKF